MPLLLRVPSLLQLLQAVRPRVATPHPAPGQLAARRCLPPAAVACRRGSRAAGGRRGRHGAGKPAAPPRAPPFSTAGRAAPSAPRSAQTEQPPLQCQQPQRRRRERQRLGPRGSRQRGTARRARTARARGHLAASGALRAVLRAPARRSDSRPARLRPRTKDRGHRAPGAAPRDRPGDGQPRRVRCTPALARRPEPEPERAPSYDSGDTAAGERACCPLGCATAAGAGGGPRRAPLSARPSPPPRAPRAPALGLRGQEPRGAPHRRRA